MSRKVKLEVVLSEELLSTIFVTAFDGDVGGCWYWATPQTGSWLVTKHEDKCARRQQFTPTPCTCDPTWTSVSIADREAEDDTWTVTLDTVADGIASILEHRQIRDDLVEQIVTAVTSGDPDIDADAADCIIQAGLFQGKIVYG